MGRRNGRHVAGIVRTHAALLAVGALAAPAAAQTVAPPPAAWQDDDGATGRIEPVRYGEPASPPPAADDGRARSYESAGQALSQAASKPRALTPTRSASTRRPSSGGNQLAPVGSPRVQRARVSKGSGQLPNDAGQVWREYDIRPYTARTTAEEQGKPQQRIVDWVLRETGYEAWHSETFGILNADREKLTVYHTPAMQAIVADIVDRFVNSRATSHAFSMRIMTVRNPDWRVKALRLMTPISVQSPGLQGWVLPKENHALLLSDLAKRGDVRDYTAAGQLVPNGRSIVFSTMRPRGYVKGIVATQNAWPGYQPEMGQLDEGASLEFNPLLSLNMETAEAVIKLRLHQVEKMRRVTLDLPLPASPTTPNANNQRLQVEVPQLTMANLHERFRWPADQVLLLSMGMVATPGPEQGGNPLAGVIPGMPKTPPRADALLFVEARNAVTPAAGPTARAPGAPVSTASRPTPTFSGRY